MTHVAITGASSGIGAALVREFALSGANVTLVARRQAEMETVAAAAGGSCQIFAVDLSDVAGCCDWLAPAAARFGPVDILINNAGVQFIEPAAEHSSATIDKMMAVNLLSPLRLTSAVLPEMLARGSGTIVDVSSMAGLTPTPGMWGYSATKAGLAAAGQCLRTELHGRGVHVLTVFPGPVATPMGEAGWVSYPKWLRRLARVLMLEGDATELAQKIRSAIELKQSTLVYPGSYLFASLFPSLAHLTMSRFMPPPVSRRPLPPQAP